MSKRLTSVVLIGMMICIAFISACATPTPQIIEKTVEVEKIVEKTVEVVETVEVEVTKEVEKIVEVTPEPVAYWDPADVTAATGPEACVPVATLPKEMSQDWILGFINVLKSHPFHGMVAKGVEEAAKFYGVEYLDGDTAGAGGTAAIEMGNTLLLDKPNVIGIIGQGPDTRDPIAQAAYDAGTIFLSVDSGRSEWSPYVYGIGDARSGKAAGAIMVEGLKKRLASDWAGKELFFLEFTHSAIAICLDRTGSLRDVVVAEFGIDEDHILQADGAAGVDQTAYLLDQLTAHPDAAFAFTGCWDGMAIAPYNAAKEAGRESDLMMVTMGGDQTPAEMLYCKPQGFYGYLEFQPFCEGWSWVETALAILEGEPFVPYQTRFVTTQDNIQERFVQLYGDPPACE
jgi:ABC-type sugar transport system substrate-binding protein